MLHRLRAILIAAGLLLVQAAVLAQNPVTAPASQGAPPPTPIDPPNMGVIGSFAFLASVLVLMIVCMPSRKAGNN